MCSVSRLSHRGTSQSCDTPPQPTHSPEAFLRRWILTLPTAGAEMDVAVSLIRLVEPVCTGPVILEEHAKPRHLRGNLTGTSHRCGRTGRPWVSEDVQGLKTVDVRWSWPWWGRCIPLCGPLRNSLLRSVLWLLCREDMTNLSNSLQIRKSVTTKTNGSDSQQGKKKGRPQKQERESRQGKGRLVSSS